MITEFEQLPYLWQTETLICVDWWGERGLQTTLQQLKDDLKQEVLRIWNEGKYDQNNLNNVLRHLSSGNDRRDSVKIVFNRFVNHKNTGRFGDGIDEAYRGWGGRFTGIINDTYQRQRDVWVSRNQQLQQTIKNAQIQLGVTNLNNLPSLPQGQTLQSLIDYYNGYNTIQQAINNIKQCFRKC